MNVPARNLPRVVTIETQSPRLVYHMPAILFAQTLAHISSREFVMSQRHALQSLWTSDGVSNES